MLIVDDSDEMRLLIKLVVKKHYSHVNIVEASSGSDALACLKNDDSIKCVISDYEMPAGSGGELLAGIRKMGSGVPVILCTSRALAECPEFSEYEFTGYMQKPFGEKKDKLLLLLQECFDRAEENGTPEEFFPVSTKVLLHFASAPSDIYIKISPGRYVKIFNSGDAFTLEDYEKYTTKGVFELHLLGCDSEMFLQKIMSELGNRTASDFIDDPNTILSCSRLEPDLQRNLAELARNAGGFIKNRTSFGSLLEVSEKTHQSIRRLLATKGFSREVENAVKTSVVRTVETINQCDSLKELFDFFKANPGSFLSSHSTVLAYITGYLASLIGWTSEFTKYKLSLASFVHDLTLKNDKLVTLNDDFAALTTDGRLSAQEIEAYLRHPVEAAALLRKFEQIPPDVEMIVVQHHESPFGDGFPDSINANMFHPLSALFLIAHEYLDFCSLRSSGWDLELFLASSGNRYSSGPFRPIVKMLKTKP
ncbi:MAG: hypothetical protein A2583_01140 [Bdellovibrionales bacterium RIFOXYD1_FULL_53_11]|nr:MAG: hypothetical protein A2583_01140 [Bdellovibrionales bacterium RIFOXYD1_FULL_53_11]